jgi:hypothetical protein
MRSTERAIILVSGTQGAGKSTVAAILAGRFERAVHIEADVLHGFIVSGRATEQDWRPPEPTGAARAEIDLRARNAALLADSFYDAGYTVVVSEIVLGYAYEWFSTRLRGRPLLLVNLAPSLAAVRKRVAARHKTEPFEPWSPIVDQAMRATLHGVGLWIDSSDQTPDETVDEIVRRVWTEGVLHTKPRV